MEAVIHKIEIIQLRSIIYCIQESTVRLAFADQGRSIWQQRVGQYKYDKLITYLNRFANENKK